MSTTYHHGNLRAALIETAIELGRESGPEGVVIREAARRTGVSHNAAYRHFADRDELLGEVAAYGLSQLAEAMATQVGKVRAGTPLVKATAKLAAVGRAYVDFALKEPGLFRVAFGAPAAPRPGIGPYEVLSATLDECERAGAIATEKRPEAETTCWSTVHGFALLHLEGPLAMVTTRQRNKSLTAVLDRVHDGLR